MASRFEHPVEMFRCRIPDAGTGRGGFGVEADIKSPKTEFVRRLSLSLILSFFKSSSHLIAIYYTHTHKVLLLVVVVVARTRAQEEEKRKRERERERERVRFFSTAKRDSQKKHSNI